MYNTVNKSNASYAYSTTKSTYNSGLEYNASINDNASITSEILGATKDDDDNVVVVADKGRWTIPTSDVTPSCSSATVHFDLSSTAATAKTLPSHLVQSWGVPLARILKELTQYTFLRQLSLC